MERTKPDVPGDRQETRGREPGVRDPSALSELIEAVEFDPDARFPELVEPGPEPAKPAAERSEEA